MIEQKDYQSIDEIFRSTLEKLPETPSQNGWDSPSPEVWKNVQANIQTPVASNGNWLRLLGILGAATVVTTAVLLMRQPKNGTVPPVSSPENTSVQPVASPEPQPAASPSAAQPAPEKPDAKPTTTAAPKPKTTTTKGKNSTEEPSPAKPVELSTPPTTAPAKETATEVAPAPSPEKKNSDRPIPPNSTVRNKENSGGGN